ncbi:NAD-dependent epimerase/dehydratase family protein [Runella salmonicolor]|uniref:NAD-dependent epimerase/dehydratase family protein n=1 Tax=Runella salmonicolor TaxID=2950278 RepID=A0ABT1FJT7_9BACT|nr:NAD-dependent epimerase/dehydratase family protein [Runella salmonicolor]MCP1382035.1 NAD-dependent epimerase/dehydratase family protein [Runella salmonicolor]
MKILILGGTGAMGIHLVELLGKENNEIFVTTRSKKQSRGNVHYLQGNARDIDFLETHLQQEWDAIVDFMVYTTAEFKSRVNLLLSATGQYIYLSSARVYANSESPIIEASDRLLDVSKDEKYLRSDEYALTKARQENILESSGQSNWTIIRPYITYSENRLQLGVLEKESWLYRAVKGRTIVFSKDINDRVSTLTYGLDVSKGIVSIIGEARALGEVFHITSSQDIRWSDVLGIYLNVLENNLGFRPKVLLNELGEFKKIHSSNYQIIYDRLYNRQFNNTKINRFIDITTFKPVEEGLRNCLTDFLSYGKFDTINWKLEAIKDKHTKEHTPLREIAGYKQKISYLIHRYIKN